MNEVEIADYRRKRLLDAIDHLCQGDRTAFGRRLGYRDGAFVRQMLSGTRGISERTVYRVESLPGMKGWFAGSQSAVYSPGPAKIEPIHDKRACLVAEKYVASGIATQRVVELVLRSPYEPVPVWASRALVSAVDTVLAIAEAAVQPESDRPKRLRR